MRFSRASKMLTSQTIAGTRGSVLNRAEGGGVPPDTFEPTLGRQLPTGHATPTKISSGTQLHFAQIKD